MKQVMKNNKKGKLNLKDIKSLDDLKNFKMPF